MTHTTHALTVERIDSPIDGLTLVTSPDQPGTLLALSFGPDDRWLAAWLKRHYGSSETAPASSRSAVARELAAYFEGDVDALDRIATDAPGTPFQQRVWAELRRIPVGSTISYGELARRIGEPSAVRAAASANARNPIAIVVPCHRVIAADGTLHGYAGGLDRKRWLLQHEARNKPEGLWAQTSTTSSRDGERRAPAKKSTT